MGQGGGGGLGLNPSCPGRWGISPAVEGLATQVQVGRSGQTGYPKGCPGLLGHKVPNAQRAKGADPVRMGGGLRGPWRSTRKGQGHSCLMFGERGAGRHRREAVFAGGGRELSEDPLCSSLCPQRKGSNPGACHVDGARLAQKTSASALRG